MFAVTESIGMTYFLPKNDGDAQFQSPAIHQQLKLTPVNIHKWIPVSSHLLVEVVS
jgi:hypothetical protein